MACVSVSSAADVSNSGADVPSPHMEDGVGHLAEGCAMDLDVNVYNDSVNGTVDVDMEEVQNDVQYIGNDEDNEDNEDCEDNEVNEVNENGDSSQTSDAGSSYCPSGGDEMETEGGEGQRFDSDVEDESSHLDSRADKIVGRSQAATVGLPDERLRGM
jgi:hypothetical protein